VKDEWTKNQRENDEAQESQTMFETGGPFSPVLSKTAEYLFQRPKKAVDESDEVWYPIFVCKL